MIDSRAFLNLHQFADFVVMLFSRTDANRENKVTVKKTGIQYIYIYDSVSKLQIILECYICSQLFCNSKYSKMYPTTYKKLEKQHMKGLT